MTPTRLQAFKLFRVRADGSIGSLFVNRAARLPIDVWMPAEDHHPHPGLAHRPGWHATPEPSAPHLTTRGRAWFLVDLADLRVIQRPESQGGLWYLARYLRIVRRVTP